MLDPPVLRDRLARYRNDYRAWRLGGLHGAKGEVEEITSPSSKAAPTPPKLEAHASIGTHSIAAVLHDQDGATALVIDILTLFGVLRPSAVGDKLVSFLATCRRGTRLGECHAHMEVLHAARTAIPGGVERPLAMTHSFVMAAAAAADSLIFCTAVRNLTTRNWKAKGGRTLRRFLHVLKLFAALLHIARLARQRTARSIEDNWQAELGRGILDVVSAGLAWADCAPAIVAVLGMYKNGSRLLAPQLAPLAKGAEVHACMQTKDVRTMAITKADSLTSLLVIEPN